MQNVNEEMLEIRDMLSSVLQRVNNLLETSVELSDEPAAKDNPVALTVDPGDQDMPADDKAEDKLSVAKTSKKGRSGKLTDSQRVIRMIKRAPDGLDVNTIKRRTKFDDKKISNIVHRAYKSGKINRIGRGIYTRP